MKLIQQINSLFTSLIHNTGNIIYKILLLLALYIVLFVMLLVQPVLGFIITPAVGDVADQDYIARRDISYMDEDITAENEKKIRLNTPLVFVFQDEKARALLHDFSSLVSTASEYSTYEKYISIQRVDTDALSINQYDLFRLLLEKEPDLINLLINRYNTIINDGIIVIDKRQSLAALTGVIVGRYEEGQLSETLYDLEVLYTPEKSVNSLMKISSFGLTGVDEINIMKEIFGVFCRQTIVYDKEASERRLQNRISIEAPFYRKIKKGQFIVRRGDIISEDMVKALKAFGEQRVELGEIFSIRNILFTGIIILLLLIFSAFLINFAQVDFFHDIKNMLFAIPLLIFYVVYLTMIVFFGIEKETVIFGFFFPVSAISITFSFLYSRQLAAYFSLVVSLFFFVFTDYYPWSFIFVVASGLTAVYTISHVKRRVDLLMAGLRIALLHSLIAVFIIISNDTFISGEVVTLGLAAVLNGIGSAIMAIALIALGEVMLNSPTIFRLQELCDSSNPLLKKLFDTASGSYNHSIMVANIAEAAAIEIGCNAILARAGGLYHDIGKIENPEYFVENQSGVNIHDNLKPTVSVSIIKAHVKNGIERARKFKLPQKVIDIIAQHHGSTLIRFFYELAMEQQISNLKEEIQKTLFHYPGVNPQFPEAAIVLMADQVEAATRGLKKPTMTSIEKIISSILDDKFQEGILDDSGLTLKDITKIQKVFLKVIGGMYHTRVEYPQVTKKGKQNGKKQVIESGNGIANENKN